MNPKDPSIYVEERIIVTDKELEELREHKQRLCEHATRLWTQVGEPYGPIYTREQAKSMPWLVTVGEKRYHSDHAYVLRYHEWKIVNDAHRACVARYNNIVIDRNFMELEKERKRP